MTNETFEQQAIAEQKFLAFCGLLQWTQACVEQVPQIQAALSAQTEGLRHPSEWRIGLAMRVQTQCHYFAIGAWKIIEHRNWIVRLKVLPKEFFSEIDSFDKAAIEDLRNMREHGLEYFQGFGKKRRRWLHEKDGGIGDASSLVDTRIGNRLDYLQFGSAAERLLKRLANEPLPYPPTPPPGYYEAKLRSIEKDRKQRDFGNC